MVSKEKINRPKLYFKVIRPRIIFITWRIIFFILLFIFFFLFFSLILHFSWFLFQHFCFALAHFYFFQWSEPNTFWNSIYLHDCPSSSGIWSFIILEEYLSLPLLPSMEGDSWSGYWRKLSSSKGRLSNNFLYQWRDDER